MKVQFKRLLILVILLVFFPVVGYAETLYVTDSLNLTLRTGPSGEHKILTVIKSGRQLEVLEPGEEWSLVRLSNDKEGYVLNRYLQPNPTHKIQLEQLQISHETLKQQATTLLEENKTYKAENQKLKAAIQGNDKALKKLNADYKKLKSDSGQFLELKSKHNEVSEQLDAQTEKADALDAELSRVEKNQYIKWFLAGSGVLLLGFIVGASSKRSRRRPSLL